MDYTSARSWCLTINNWTPDEEEKLVCYDCRYCIIGYEGREDGKTPHLQGFIMFAHAKKLSTLRAAFPRAHWEIARDVRKAIAYCKKEGLSTEIGEPPGQGTRTDLTAVANKVVNGTPLAALALEEPSMFVKYHNGLAKLEHVVNPPKLRDDLKVIWLWGGTGVGKSRYAFQHFKNPYIKDATPWWDGYGIEHDVIVLDDFDNRWPFRDLLRFLDRYPYRGQVKGGYVAVNGTDVIITCDRPPEVLFGNLREHERAQLLRRLTTVLELKPPTTEVTEVEGNTTSTPELSWDDVLQLLE